MIIITFLMQLRLGNNKIYTVFPRTSGLESEELSILLAKTKINKKEVLGSAATVE